MGDEVIAWYKVGAPIRAYNKAKTQGTVEEKTQPSDVTAAEEALKSMPNPVFTLTSPANGQAKSWFDVPEDGLITLTGTDGEREYQVIYQYPGHQPLVQHYGSNYSTSGAGAITYHGELCIEKPTMYKE